MASVTASLRDVDLSASEPREFLDDLPRPSPLSMPVQTLHQAPTRDFGPTAGQPWARRGGLVAFTLATTTLAVLALHLSLIHI